MWHPLPNQENNADIGKTYVYTYDKSGNIQSKKVYAYTTGTLGTLQDTINYTYGNTAWKDQLTNYDGTAISYDASGNPTNWIGNLNTLTWNGRQLTTLRKGTSTYSYVYNSDGIRTQKTVVTDGVYMTLTTHYVLDGTNVVAQYQTATNTMDLMNVMYFYYDEAGAPTGIKYNGNVYYFQMNLQGDIIRILNTQGSIVATYTYDAWGNIIASTDTSGVSIGTKNPFRYRGYYYDTETGFYYVSSRYYDPEIGRWINADSLLNQESVLGNNMFAYCLNNPVNMADTTGELPFFLVTAAICAVAGAIIGGVVAAKNGGNVWAGIGTGAAAGGLAGAGLGAAAGVMLAASATASTAAVASGAGMLATAVSTGGAGVGLALIVDNISRAVNNVGTVLYSGGEQARQVATTFANNTGGTTIDSTVIGQVADAATKVPGADFTTVWSQASATFCHQASGVVNAFVSNSAYSGVDSFFWSVEMPTLLSNPRVTEIIIHIFE